MTAHHDDAVAVTNVLVPLIKYALSDDDAAAATFRTQAWTAQQALRARLRQSFPADINLDSLWSLAVDEAERDRQTSASGGVSLSLPKLLPFPSPMLLDDPFAPDALRLQIRGAAATG